MESSQKEKVAIRLIKIMLQQQRLYKHYEAIGMHGDVFYQTLDDASDALADLYDMPEHTACEMLDKYGEKAINMKGYWNRNGYGEYIFEKITEESNYSDKVAQDIITFTEHYVKYPEGCDCCCQK